MKPLHPPQGSDIYSMCFHSTLMVGLEMRSLVAVLLAICLIPLVTGSAVGDMIAQNFTERDRVFIIGYMEDSKVLQTQKGYSGLKMAMGTSGSGIATRTVESEIYADSNMEEGSMVVDSDYNYRPYTPPLAITQSDLKNALCAKNYEVGSSFSESYSNIKDLVKDTRIYQDDNTSIYDINSQVQGVARIGSRVQKNAQTVPSYISSGTYIGYVDISVEMQVGNMSILNLPCP
jgi:hypothetical protein